MKLKFEQRLLSIKSAFFFSSIYRISFEIFLDVGFASLYNIENLQWENYVDVYSNSVAFFWALFLAIILLSIPILYWFFSEKLDSENGRFKVLFKDYKMGNTYILDHFIFMLRRVGLSCLLIFGWKHGFIQTIIFLSMWIFVFIWKITIKPFNRTVLNVQIWIFEFFLMLIVTTYLGFQSKSAEFSKKGIANILGFIWVALVLSMILINIFVTVYLWFKKKTPQISIKTHGKFVFVIHMG